MDDEDRSRLETGLAEAVSTAREAIAAAVDALGTSRNTQRVARRTIREAAATAADSMAGPGVVEAFQTDSSIA